MLGSQAGPAASAVTPQLRTGLVSAGVPAASTGRIVTQFRGCLHDRLVAADPTVTPAACRAPGGPQALPAAAHPVLARAGGAAMRDDFTASVERTLWFQAGVFGLSFLLMLLLPRGAGRRPAASGEAGAGTDQAPSVQEGAPA
jgi:hypothetical protein